MAEGSTEVALGASDVCLAREKRVRWLTLEAEKSHQGRYPSLGLFENPIEGNNRRAEGSLPPSHSGLVTRHEHLCRLLDSVSELGSFIANADASGGRLVKTSVGAANHKVISRNLLKQ